MAQRTQRNLNIISRYRYGCDYNNLGCFIRRDNVNEDVDRMSQEAIDEIGRLRGYN